MLRATVAGLSHVEWFPFGARQNAGQQIIGEDALRAFIGAVDRKSDALVEKGLVSRTRWRCCNSVPESSSKRS